MDIYFVVNKDRPDIKKHWTAQWISFKGREKWIADHGPIRIGYLNDDAGVGVMDPATGELTGVIKDYVELAKDCLQGQTLEFDLKGYDTRNEQLQALHTGEIGLIFHVSQNPYSAETNGFVLSDTIWTFNMAATTAKDSFNENAENTVAVTKDNFALKAYI